jgi:predicted RNase H-like HicB family nuclease
MKLSEYQNLIDLLLTKRGYPVSIHDLPDVDFYSYFDESFTLEEAFQAAAELIEEMIELGDLPSFDDLASVDFEEEDL